MSWELVPLGDTALLCTWQGSVTMAGNMVAALAETLRKSDAEGVIELVPGITSVLVCYDPLRAPYNDLRAAVEPYLPRSAHDPLTTGHLIEIPVAYGGDDGPDLADVAATCGLTEAEVIALHTAQPMPVLMIGFMPGFPYIGGLPSALHLPRRATPRTSVPARSVAIANDQTGIYPRRSPGGWHLIGRASLELFDPHRNPPALLQAGDRVWFRTMDDG